MLEEEDRVQLDEVRRKLGKAIPKHERSRSLPVIQVIEPDQARTTDGNNTPPSPEHSPGKLYNI